MLARHVWLTALAIGMAGIIPATPAAQTPTYSFSTLATFRGFFGPPEGAAYFKGTLLVVAGMFLRTVTPTGVTGDFPSPIEGTSAVAFDDAGMAYVAFGCGVGKAGRNVDFTVLAGPRFAHQGCGSADGNATAAKFNHPGGIAVNGAGTAIYVADTGNSTIRLVTSTGETSTIAGAAAEPGTADGLGIISRFSQPYGLALDPAGNLFIADRGNHTIRRMTPDGMVTTVAGVAGSAGAADGTGPSARFKSPAGLAVGPDGNLYVADEGNSLVRRVTPAGAVTTIATPVLSGPRGIALDEVGTLYVVDRGNQILLQGVLGTAAAPSIATQPASVTVKGGATSTFTVAVSGNPSPGLLWQTSTNGGVSWSDVAEAAPYSGTRTPALTISSVTGPLNGGRYRAVAANPSGSVTSAVAVLAVDAITVVPIRLQFAASKAGPSGALTAVTSPQDVSVVFSINNSTWTATADQPWLQLTSANGSGRGIVSVGVINPDNVIGGSSLLTATVTVSSASGLATAIPVSLSVDQSNTTRAPGGLIDTPANGATGLQGSIAVSGWAIDDIGVDRVEIWRDPVAGETTGIFSGAGPANGKIFIGTAAFVSGARPDVARTYFTYPNADRAGWGYLMLTYGLPNQGNGMYRLYAIAMDVNGVTSSIIGATTIGVDNARATRPFGSIDTPGQGGTVSGTIHNFGWALTPGGSCSVADVQVSFDSGPLLPVVYGDVRPDVAAAFPGYTNAAAAGAHYTLDTTQLTDGVHTIGWLVSDSCGRAEGVGSRFFTVTNGGSALTAAPAASIAAVADGERREWTIVRGTSVDAPPATADGTRVVRIAEGERIELQLPGNAPYAARQLVNGSPRGLPLGSSFDAAGGKFYWQPAAGFLGTYDLEFTRDARTERVRAVVGPPIRLAIDTPRAGNVLSPSGFTLAGWAVDLASLDGAGIDTLHVWAYPVGGGPPRFVGVASAGGRRPDVARLYGEAFTGAGFMLDGTLAPGTYDLVVYAHSAASNAFAGAETVRVVVR
jgi:DNA-binding beta-propeller fold protein YncE